MTEKLSRREFVKAGAAAVAGAIAGGGFDELVAIGDLDALSEDQEPSPLPATRAPMDVRIRKVLREVGIYPIEKGIKDARLDPEMYKRNIMQCLEHLSPADLAAVGYVAMCLQQPDVSPSPVEAMDPDAENELTKDELEFREMCKQLTLEEQRVVNATVRGLFIQQRASRVLAGA